MHRLRSLVKVSPLDVFNSISNHYLLNRYSKKWNRADKTVMLFQPPLEPAGSVIDAVSKEYEVQVGIESSWMNDKRINALIYS